MVNRNLCRFLLLMSVLIVLIGCTTTKSFDRWPTREIDRPYTLPDRIDSWTSEFSTKLKVREHGLEFSENNFNAFQWEQSLTDDWELVWSPLPLSVKHQFSYDQSGYTGAELGAVPFYSSSGGWGGLSVINLEYMTKLTGDLAFKMLGFGSVLVPFAGGSSAYLVDLGPAIVAQIDSNQSLTLGTMLLYTDFYKLGNFSIDGVKTNPENNFDVSIGGHYLYSLGRQWNLRLGWLKYLINGNGINMEISLVNYW